MEIMKVHPQVTKAMLFLEQRLGNGDGQITAADLLAAHEKAAAEAQRFVTVRGALGAVLGSLAVGIALGFLGALVLL